MSKTKSKIKVPKLDGLVNVLTGLGVKGKDKKTGNAYFFSGKLKDNMLRDIFRGMGIGRKIAERPAFDMIRTGWRLEGDSENSYEKIYEDLGLIEKIQEALVWDRLFGGSLIVLGVVDGGLLTDEIGKNPQRIDFIRIIAGNNVKVDLSDLENDKNNSRFGLPKFYRVVENSQSMMGYRVHYSRCFPLKGLLTPEESKTGYTEFGDSALQPVWDALLRLASTYSNTQSVVEDFVQAVLKIKNLQTLLMQGKESAITKRMEILDLGKSLINTMLIGDGEEYEKKASSVSGLTQIIQEFQIEVSSESEIPATLLFGRSPAGMNATGDSDFQGYYDKIEGLQTFKLKPIIKFLNKIIESCSEYDVVDDYGKIVFNSLKSMNPKEISEIRKINSETDMTYLQYNIVTEEEVRSSRFENGYSDEISVNGSIDNRGANNPEEGGAYNG